ncbi:MAG: FecR family protein, partial [Halobacteriovoraceae bacterium]|nr:FecR family protein [Halobacteriovoraceae bacterium]
MVFDSGDVIQTGASGLAIIKSPELTIKVIKDSRIKLYFKKGDKTSAWVSKGGAVFNLLKSKIKPTEDRLQVRTKSASLGVRGTVFMAYSGKEENSILSVKSGKVSFQGYSSEKALLVGSDSSALTNKDKENLRPRNFGLIKRINWNFDTNKDLKQSEEFFSYADKVWMAYKKEQEVRWKNYKKEQEDVWNNFINN